MNSFIAIELNSFLSEFVKEHPITGKLQLDQRLVTMAVTLLTTYLVVVVAKISEGWFYILYRYIYKDHYLIHNHKNDNIIHVWIKDSGFLYIVFNKYIPTLPIAKKSIDKNNNNQITFVVTPVGDDGNKPWTIEEGIVKLPIDEKIDNHSHKDLSASYYVFYKNRNLMIANFQHTQYNYYHIFIEKEKNESVHNAKCFINDFISDAQYYYKNYTKKQNCTNINVYEIIDKKWINTTTLVPKRPESIIGKNAKDIMNDVDKFENELGSLYKSLDIPYKRGYLLYGPPGTGKTSIVKAIASSTKKEIFKITFNEKNMDDDDYKDLLGKTTINSIILMDDINPQLLQEGGFIEKTKTNIIDGTTSKELCRVSYNTLLDALDGINANNGRIVFITTNHPDKMGKAILRPGRIDVKRKLDYVQNDEIKDYFKMFYDYFNLDPTLISDYTNKFIHNVRNSKKGSQITFAELQQFLVQYLEDIDSAVNNAHNIFEHKEIKPCI